MDKDLFGRRVVKLLNDKDDAVPDAVLEKLAMARATALATARLSQMPITSTPSQAAKVSKKFKIRLSDFSLNIARFALPVALVFLVANEAWNHHESIRLNELVELDVGLLDDDLPLEAYNDQGFESFLEETQDIR